TWRSQIRKAEERADARARGAEVERSLRRSLPARAIVDRLCLPPSRAEIGEQLAATPHLSERRGQQERTRSSESVPALIRALLGGRLLNAHPMHRPAAAPLGSTPPTVPPTRRSLPNRAARGVATPPRPPPCPPS